MLRRLFDRAVVLTSPNFRLFLFAVVVVGSLLYAWYRP